MFPVARGDDIYHNCTHLSQDVLIGEAEYYGIPEWVYRNSFNLDLSKALY